jgi:6-phosphogluconate dehydrogenase
VDGDRCAGQWHALKDERVAASKVLDGPKAEKISAEHKAEFIEEVRRALYCSKMISYAQGYMLLRSAEKAQGWHLNMGGVALMWRGGCIIRSAFLGDIKKAFDKDPKLENLLMDEFFSSALNKYQASWRKALIGCRRICCRRSGISSERTRMSGSTSRAGSSSTRTGPAAADGSRRRPTTHRAGRQLPHQRPLLRTMRGRGLCVWSVERSAD